MMTTTPRLLSLLALLFASSLLGCGELVGGLAGGGAGVPSGSGNVSGKASGKDFTFTASKVDATYQGTAGGNNGDLSVFLAEGDSGGSGRQVSLFAHGLETDIRNGHTYTIGRGANATVDSGGSDDAVSGEIVIESANLRVSGKAVGTFQLQLRSGGTVKGFFEAPFSAVSGASSSASAEN